MKSLPIRIRLTLWYFAMFASAALLLSLASWWMLRRAVDATEYHELHERAQDVQELLNHEAPARGLDEIRDEFAAIYNFKDDGKYLQIRDEQGNWIYRSKRMISQNPNLPAPGLLPATGQIVEFQQGIHTIRVLNYPIQAQGKRYAVQAGLSLNRSAALLASFRSDLLVLTPLVILLAAVGGHLMSRKALRPVAALAAEARRINDRNLDIRLPVQPVRDEISDLSLTLNQMLERIDHAFASVRAFTGNASHELRTPISILRMEIEVALLRPREGQQYREILSRLHEQTVRMTTLVENLLSLARADGGAETITLTPVAVDLLIRQIAATWKTAMNQALLNFSVEMQEENLTVLGDAHGITRLLSILLENASKYTPPGGAVMLRVEADPARINFSVIDTGIGIAPEHRLRIFDRFYRAAPADHPAPAGSGLGLAIASWIAGRHGTELRVESEPGRGSSFSFSLGRADAAVSVSEPCSIARA
jgi:heavy metal sensor kinase